MNIKKKCNKQKIYYNYKIGDETYRGKEFKRCDKIRYSKGDSIKIKYYAKKPSYSSINW